MSPNLEKLLAAVENYAEKYRNPTLQPFESSAPYDMSPELGPASIKCFAQWPEVWPHAGRAGIYAFLNKDLNVVYVGKASGRSSLGARISSYCGYASDRSCRFYHEWSSFPRYVLTVAVPEKTRFEAPALEEYLISTLGPSDNSAGIER